MYNFTWLTGTVSSIFPLLDCGLVPHMFFSEFSPLGCESCFHVTGRQLFVHGDFLFGYRLGNACWKEPRIGIYLKPVFAFPFVARHIQFKFCWLASRADSGTALAVETNTCCVLNSRGQDLFVAMATHFELLYGLPHLRIDEAHFFFNRLNNSSARRYSVGKVEFLFLLGHGFPSIRLNMFGSAGLCHLVTKFVSGILSSTFINKHIFGTFCNKSNLSNMFPFSASIKLVHIYFTHTQGISWNDYTMFPFTFAIPHLNHLSLVVHWIANILYRRNCFFLRILSLSWR